MTSTLRASSTGSLAGPPGALTTIAEVAALLAAAEQPSEAVADVLRMTARAMVRHHTTSHATNTMSVRSTTQPGAR